MSDPWPLPTHHLKRNRTCRCCGGGKGTREHRPAPTPDDPDYKVAVCPHCDLMSNDDERKCTR